MMNWCTKLLVNYPLAILTFQSSAGIVCFILIAVFGSVPDFRDPTLGFETRGTYISNRIRSYERLIAGTFRTPLLSVSHEVIDTNSSDARESSKVSVAPDEDYGVSYETDERLSNTHVAEKYFCDIPRPEYAKVVFQSQDGGSLWSAEKIQSMCRLEEIAIRSRVTFKSTCIQNAGLPLRCCRSVSAGNYVALLANRSSCFDVAERDVMQVRVLLQRCSASFRANLHLPAECWDSDFAKESRGRCGGGANLIPRTCRRRESAVYHLLFHVVDRGFADPDNIEPSSKSPKYTVSFLPIAAGGPGAERLYLDMESQQVFGDALTRFAALDFGLKQSLFDWYLVRDTVWFGVALLCVGVSVALYAKSIFIAIATFIVITVSLGAAYLVYTFVIGIKFFPFMNLLAALVLVGVGVDDAFIYLEAWSHARSQRDSPSPSRLIWNALQHSTPSAFASSATTAAAFFAGAAATDITVLRCFGLFAGLSVVLHFVILVTTKPAVIVVHDRYCTSVVRLPAWLLECRCFVMLRSLRRISSEFVSWTLPCLVVRFRFVVLSVFGGLAAAAAFVVFVYPKLRLPTTGEFQLFAASHPFEVYDLYMRSRFWFGYASLSGNDVTMPLTVVFGVFPGDDGSRLDPEATSGLVYDDSFDIGAPESRRFLLSFCRTLRRSAYYRSTQGFQLTECFVENFERFMRRGCEDVDGRRLEPCCGTKSNATYGSAVFHRCLKEYVPSLLQSSLIYSGASRDAGLRFDRVSGKPVALVVEFASTEPFSANFTSMRAFHDNVDAVVVEELSAAPVHLRSGFFTSHLAFYDLQRAIASGTPAAIGLAVGASTVVALLATVNVVVAAFAMLTVAASICVTTASLIGLGWTLNVVESVTISVAVGLSVDFALHHAVAYRLADSGLDRHERVLAAARSIAVPVAMSALTTFFVGLCLMPSTVLAYQQLGVFLMIVISSSWMYSTFFLQALLSLVGPVGRFGQLTLTPIVRCCQMKAKTMRPQRSEAGFFVEFSFAASAESSQEHQVDNGDATESIAKLNETRDRES